MQKIRLATRGSKLAVAQTGTVARLLEAAGVATEIVPVDRNGSPDTGPGPGGDKARFVRTVEQALLDARADIGVHSAKDLPADVVPEDLVIAAVPERAPAADVWIGRAGEGPGIHGVPSGLIVGTASLRRRSQLLALRPDLDVRVVRGNVDTRLAKLDAGEYDALVLAKAGLSRLGLDDVATFEIAAEEMLPAAGQGALVLQVRDDDEKSAAAARSVNNPVSHRTLLAERAFLQGLEADCDSPVAAHCSATEQGLSLSAYVGQADGTEWLTDRAVGSDEDPAALGAHVADRLLSAGAREILRPDSDERANA